MTMKTNPSDKPISDSSAVNISLPFLIQAIGFISALVWGYGQLNTRLQFVEQQADTNARTLKEMKDMQDDPIPSDVRQDEKIKTIENEIERLRNGQR